MTVTFLNFIILSLISRNHSGAPATLILFLHVLITAWKVSYWAINALCFATCLSRVDAALETLVG